MRKREGQQCNTPSRKGKGASSPNGPRCPKRESRRTGKHCHNSPTRKHPQTLVYLSIRGVEAEEGGRSTPASHSFKLLPQSSLCAIVVVLPATVKDRASIRTKAKFAPCSGTEPRNPGGVSNGPTKKQLTAHQAALRFCILPYYLNVPFPAPFWRFPQFHNKIGR